MTKAELMPLVVRLESMCSTFGDRNTKVRAEVLFEALEEYPVAAVARGVAYYLKTNKNPPFPTPGAILEAMELSREPEEFEMPDEDPAAYVSRDEQDQFFADLFERMKRTSE